MAVHDAARVREYLESIFPGRVILSGLQDHLTFSERFFFLLYYVEPQIYNIPIYNPEELHLKINNCIQIITEDTLNNIRQSFYDRLE